MSDEEHDYFREYHRVGARMLLTRLVGGIAAAAAIVAALTFLAAGAPPTPPPADADAPAVTASPSPTPVAEVLPAPAETTAATPTPAPTPSTGPDSKTWSIAIDTTGYQAEIDQCLWVRMDLGLDAPLVGAHNYCGGSVVLEMAVGDLVSLTGTGLDGTYRVSEERLANAGDNAAEATAGLEAVVILQTCFWANDGSERLIALVAA